MRASGDLTEIRTTDLRFGFDEIITFLNDIHGLNLSREQMATLDSKIEGWIAGLCMSVLAMKGRKNTEQFLRNLSGSHRYFLDYFTDEVLDSTSPNDREFLLFTSILEQMTGTLCNAITQRHDGQATLHRLEDLGLFIIPMDDKRCWYRYHHLFADMIKSRLQDLYPISAVAELHNRAATWYEQECAITHAIDHALAAGNKEYASSLFEQNALDMITGGGISDFAWISKKI